MGPGEVKREGNREALRPEEETQRFLVLKGQQGTSDYLHQPLQEDSGGEGRLHPRIQPCHVTPPSSCCSQL